MTGAPDQIAPLSDGLGWCAPNPVRCRLETPRLIVRCYTLDDAPALHRLIVANRAYLLPWMPWARQHDNPAATARYVAEQVLACTAGPAFTGLGVGVFERDTGELVGGTGVHDVRSDTASCETGYWIRADRRNRGYATEACARVISWALSPPAEGGLGLRRVRAYCSGANAPSRRVLEKLGLTHEVRQRDDLYVETLGPTDRLGWGVLASEWDTAHHRAVSPGGG